MNLWPSPTLARDLALLWHARQPLPYDSDDFRALSEPSSGDPAHTGAAPGSLQGAPKDCDHERT
jgi:hypothetical protein